MEKTAKVLKSSIIRFAGDSGDGMQLTGTQFTQTTAELGNDLSTLPDYPAEIRAPAGTLFGVSGFQIQFSSDDIHSPGDEPDILVAMNPAALKVNLKDLKKGGMIIANVDAFNKKNLELAKYDTNPLEDGSLDRYQLFVIPITKTTTTALQTSGLNMKEITRCKNFFALGIMYWMFNRSMDTTIDWIRGKFKKLPKIMEANITALKAGYNFGDTTEIFTTRYEVAPAKLEKGTYRNISGNEATALGMIAASQKSGLPLFLGSYPITPASEILHELSRHKNFGVKTFQAEDEIAGICSAIGASFGGALGLTTTSGPGLALKTEAIGLAVMVELPLVIINVQRGGPSTGLPTKTEQADLLQAMYARNGESPVPVVAASTPADCFTMAYEAARLALKFMTPVICLTDGYLANGSEPWKIPESKGLPEIKVNFVTNPEGFQPYQRDENLSRPWAIPGTPGLEHRIGGLEKENVTGNVCYIPENHQLMVNLRAQKVKNIENDIPLLEVEGPEEGELLVVGWGSTYGAIQAAYENMMTKGYKFSKVHLKYLNPFQKNLGEILKRFKNVLVCEMNLGQLAKLLRMEYLVDVKTLNKVQGLPFKAIEIENKIIEILNTK
ncbi:MAG: 2-oxoacid:acceptor oxidoreductase subunit alpha [Ignavibacteriae bacterium]|nr:MAG: 2-oxoacid:acceptor oxidoreductase subunit alpha [Ignavibacteriota bacterium]